MELNPNLLEGQLALANALRHLKQFPEARACYAKFLAQVPQNSPAAVLAREHLGQMPQ